jgi:hypothetical protein
VLRKLLPIIVTLSLGHLYSWDGVYAQTDKTPSLVRQVNGSKQRVSNPAISFHKKTLKHSSILVGVIEQNRGTASTAKIEDDQKNTYTLLKMSSYVDNKSEWCAIYVARKIKGGPNSIRAWFNNGGGYGMRGIFVAEITALVDDQLDDASSAGGRKVNGHFPNMNLILPRWLATDLMFTIVNSEGNDSTIAPKGFSSLFVVGDGIAWSEHPVVGNNGIQWGGKFNYSSVDFTAAAVLVQAQRLR